MVWALGLGPASRGPAWDIETLRICAAVKESSQGINTAFLPLLGAADGVLG